MMMCQYLVKIFLVLVTINVAYVTSLNAELMKLDFEGSITSISPPYAPSGINLGDNVFGELIYESATPDEQPLTWMGYYEDPIKSFNLIIGSKSFPMRTLSESSEIDVINDDLVWDRYYDSIYFRVAVLDQEIQVYRFFQLTFVQSDTILPTVLTSGDLTTAFDINEFETKTGFLTYLPPGASEGNNITLTHVQLYPVNQNLGSMISPWLMLLLD